MMRNNYYLEALIESGTKNEINLQKVYMCLISKLAVKTCLCAPRDFLCLLSISGRLVHLRRTSRVKGSKPTPFRLQPSS